MNDGPRILIVDNYDSFTYNLAHHLRSVSGSEVRVVLNNDIDFLEGINENVLFDSVDLIVLSPGPGNPYTDIGCVGEFIIHSCLSAVVGKPRPVLFGVCMGYEAVGVRCGVKLIKTVPRHGERWNMIVDRHADSDTLFRGLPDIFHQVRYHSLILEPESLESSDTLIVTSRCEDLDSSAAKSPFRTFGPETDHSKAGNIQQLSLTGFEERQPGADHLKTMIPMSFRHRSLPIYGVQFHPESILSDHGRDILRNVCFLAGIPTPGDEGILSMPKQLQFNQGRQSKLERICSLSKSDLSWWPLTFYSGFARSACIPSVWLDSPMDSSGRWSFLTGGKLGETSKNFSVYGSYGQMQRSLYGSMEWGLKARRADRSALFPALDLITCRFRTTICERYEVPLAVPTVFTCMGYEYLSSASTENLDAIFYIADRVIAIDNITGDVFALFVDGDDGWINDIRECMINMKPEIPPTIPPGPSEIIFKVADCKSCYMDKIRTCQTAIELGESYELCLTTQIESQDEYLKNIDPLTIYSNLRSMNPAHYSAYIETGEATILMASPERFLHVDGSRGIAQVKPIKGTRKRGDSPGLDEQIRTELSQSRKDRAENLMIVDLVRNDLSTVCIPGSVWCPKLMEVETYAPYHQLVSTVEGTLPPSDPARALSEVITKLFPAGSMTGAPKIRSMQILEAIEGRRRGIGYSGAIGYISPLTGYADLAVSIRSITVSKEGKYTIGCGGAILAISDPEEEWREMILKAKRSLEVIALSAGVKGVLLEYSDKSETMFIRAPLVSPPTYITTMRYEAEKGFWLYKRHLQRLMTAVGNLMTFHELEARVCDAIATSEQRISDRREFDKPFIPLLEAPFEGIGDEEWERGPFLSLKAARVRVGITVESDAMPRITCEISPLLYVNPSVAKINRNVRADRADRSLTHKTMEWYMPSVVPREMNLIVNDQELITETGIANVAFRIDGKWITPSTESAHFVSGTLRAALIEKGHLAEGQVPIDSITENLQILCINSIRGVFTVDVAF